MAEVKGVSPNELGNFWQKNYSSGKETTFGEIIDGAGKVAGSIWNGAKEIVSGGVDWIFKASN